MQSQDKFWLVNKDGEVACLPHPLYLLMIGVRKKTFIFGPYIFYNNFEESNEAAYLKKIFQYPHLTPTPEKKVRTIMEEYSPFVEPNEEFIQALMIREALISPDNVWLEAKEEINGNKN